MSQEINRRQLLVLGGAVAAVAVMGIGTTQVMAADDDTGTVDIGVPEDFKDGVSDKFGQKNQPNFAAIFVVRDGGKIYAISAYCSHKKNLLKVVDGQIRCPAHGSRFDNSGKPTKSPASTPIPRFAISKNAAGHLIVDKSKKFDESDWNNPASFIEVK